MFFRNGQAEQYRRALGEREEGIEKVYLPPSAARKKHLKISQCFLGSASLVSCPMPPWTTIRNLNASAIAVFTAMGHEQQCGGYNIWPSRHKN